MNRISVGTVNISAEAKRLVNAALDANRISQGRLVGEFERQFAAYHGPDQHAVACATGTAADTLALAALHDRGARRGQVVIIPALTFVATANAVCHARFTPHFVDVDPDTWQMDPNEVERALRCGSVAAIMPVHLLGQPAPMRELLALADQYDVPVVEDAAEAHGARYDGQLVGTLGLMGAFSFYTAHIITTGEGGAVLTRDGDLAGVLRSLRAHGRACTCAVCKLNTGSEYCPTRFRHGDIDTRFYFERLGYSEKMNELEAALGLAQVAHLDTIVDARRANLFYLNERLAHRGDVLQFMAEGPRARISPMVYPLVIRDGAPFMRQQMTHYLEERGVDTRPLFGSIPTQQPAYAFLGYRRGDFPHAEAVGERGFYVGVHQDLSREDLDRLVWLIDEFIERTVRNEGADYQ